MSYLTIEIGDSKITPEPGNSENASGQEVSEETPNEEEIGRGVKIKRFFQKFELKSEAPQNLLASGLWQIVGTFIGSFLIWLLVVLISRGDIGLGAVGIGIFNTALAIFKVFAILTMGLGKATSQIVSENMSDKKVAFEHARNGTIAAIIVGIIIGVALIITSFFLGEPLSFQKDSEISSIFFVIGIVMLFTGFRDGLSSNLAAVGEYDDIAKANAINPLFQFLSGIIVILLLKYFNLSITLSSLIIIVLVFGMIAQTLYLTKHFRKLWFNAEIFRINRINRKSFKLVKQGFYFAITDIIPVGILGFISVIILLAFTQDYAIVGSYSIVLGYSLGALMVAGFAWPLITSVAEAYGVGNTNRIKFYLHLIVKIFFYVTFLVLATIIGLSRGMIALFHGSNYLIGKTDVWIPFILVMCAFAVAGLEYILSSVLLGIGKGRVAAAYLGSVFLATVGFTTLFVWLNIFSGLNQAQMNASFGFLIGTLVLLPILPYLIKKYVKQSIPWSIGIKSLLALACTLLVAAVLVWPPLGVIPISNIFFFVLIALLLGLLFVVLLVFFGSIPPEDVDLLERKAREYNLQKIANPILSFIRKIMKISPFCKFPKEE